jgi:hypothetical protein
MVSPYFRFAVKNNRPDPTPAALGAELTQVVPLDASTLPAVPGATKLTALVPLPKMTLLAVSVVLPVPPLATGIVPVTAAVVWTELSGNCTPVDTSDVGI